MKTKFLQQKFGLLVTCYFFLVNVLSYSQHIQERYYNIIQNLNDVKYVCDTTIIDDAAFALSIDPLADKFASEDPYNAMADNPIIYVDPSGKAPLLCVALSNTPEEALDNCMMAGELGLLLTGVGELPTIARGTYALAKEAYYGYKYGKLTGAVTGVAATAVTNPNAQNAVSVAYELIAAPGTNNLLSSSPSLYQNIPTSVNIAEAKKAFSIGKNVLSEIEKQNGRILHLAMDRMPTHNEIIALQDATGGEVALIYEKTGGNGVGTFHIIGDANPFQVKEKDFRDPIKYVFVGHSHPFFIEGNTYPSEPDRNVLEEYSGFIYQELDGTYHWTSYGQTGSLIYHKDGTTRYVNGRSLGRPIVESPQTIPVCNDFETDEQCK